MTSQNNIVPLLLNESDAAKAIGFTVRTLQEWRRRGGGPKYCRINNRVVRYRPADLEEWAAKSVRTSID